MKKIIKALKITSTLLFITVAFIACDKDFTSIESDIQGSENFNTPSMKFPVLTYNEKLNAVQTNSLSSNLLGVYKDDVYGQTTASIVSQVVPSTYDPDFGVSPQLVSVILTIPYFATNEGTENGETTYSMTAKDSLFGNSEIKLSIFQNNYFLRDYNLENIEDLQNYYSNANSTINFNNHVGETLFESEEFLPSPSEITLNEGTDDEEKLAPRFRKELNMPLGFWENLFFTKQDMPELSNANNFKNYFRGFYFKAEDISDEGNLILLNFNNAQIDINYTNDDSELDDNDELINEVFTLRFSGNRLNIFENNITNPSVINAYNNPNTTEGDGTLYIKGGEGSIAIIDLLEGNITVEGTEYDSYDYFKSKKEEWLINEANLVFYVDENAGLNKDQEPDRIIIYDMKNNTPLIDYFFDLTDVNNPENSKINHSTILERNSDGNGVKYKIRITEHLNNILLKDSTNLKLGLTVTTNINEVFQYSILDSENKLTSGTVMSPKGTVLHGGNNNVVDEKRIQLEVFYSCIKENGDCPLEEE